ncbi:MAG: hypothetical protein U9N35_06075 [Euryarchaeota archaeon]|nr:hypothetical protein [Euryarchaeota archaeon]
MSLGETILAVFGVRKLSTSKDYSKLKEQLDRMQEQNEAMMNIFIKQNWNTFSKEEKQQTINRLKAKKKRRSEESSEAQEALSSLFDAAKTALMLFGALFFVFWLFALLIGLLT